MGLTDRQARMAEWLNAHGRGTVQELAAAFFVSEMTVRRDLNELARGGYAQRYNGGAMCPPRAALRPIAERELLNAAEKERLSRRARRYLHDGMTVFIDSSSTCAHIVPLLTAYRGIQMVTNSMHSLALAADDHIPCIVVGGTYYEPDMCTVGSAAEAFLRGLNVDAAFFSVQGFDGELLTDSDGPQTAVRQAAMHGSAQNIFLMDPTKHGGRYLYTVCRAAEVVVDI